MESASSESSERHEDRGFRDHMQHMECRECTEGGREAGREAGGQRQRGREGRMRVDIRAGCGRLSREEWSREPNARAGVTESLDATQQIRDAKPNHPASPTDTK